MFLQFLDCTLLYFLERYTNNILIKIYTEKKTQGNVPILKCCYYTCGQLYASHLARILGRTVDYNRNEINQHPRLEYHKQIRATKLEIFREKLFLHQVSNQSQLKSSIAILDCINYLKGSYPQFDPVAQNHPLLKEMLRGRSNILLLPPTPTDALPNVISARTVISPGIQCHSLARCPSTNQWY